MAEETTKAESLVNEHGHGKSKTGLFVLLAWAVLMAGLGASGGYVVAGLYASGAGSPEKAQAAQLGPMTGQTEETSRNLAYYDGFGPILVTLNVPRLDRYLGTTIRLAVLASDLDQAAKAIEARKPELKDWLNTYLSSCTLEDVGGEKNKKRIKRRIVDAFNEMLWPEGKPLIKKVLLEEFAVQ